MLISVDFTQCLVPVSRFTYIIQYLQRCVSSRLLSSLSTSHLAPARHPISHGITDYRLRVLPVLLASLPRHIFSSFGHFSTFTSLSMGGIHKKPLDVPLFNFVIELSALIEEATFSILLLPHHCDMIGVGESGV